MRKPKVVYDDYTRIWLVDRGRAISVRCTNELGHWEDWSHNEVTTRLLLFSTDEVFSKDKMNIVFWRWVGNVKWQMKVNLIL